MGAYIFFSPSLIYVDKTVYRFEAKKISSFLKLVFPWLRLLIKIKIFY